MFLATKLPKYYVIRNLSDEKPKMKLPKYVMSQALVSQFVKFVSNFVKFVSKIAKFVSKIVKFVSKLTQTVLLFVTLGFLQI